jgi:DNA-binding XRE family transcriptional regulator
MNHTAGNPPLKSRREQLVEHQHGAPVEVLLRRLYVAEGLSQDAVAAALGVSRDAVIGWMKKYRIPTRDRRAVQAA